MNPDITIRVTVHRNINDDGRSTDDKKSVSYLLKHDSNDIPGALKRAIFAFNSTYKGDGGFYKKIEIEFPDEEII